jgi:hypothetical protein
MKKNKFLSLLAASIILGLAACNNSSDGTAANDSPGAVPADSNKAVMDNASSSGNYSAFADSVERNSKSGYYLNPKTGKKLNLKVDRTSGTITDAQTNEPVWRYVDNRNWWVYGIDDDYYWDNMGEAKMQSDKLIYKDDNNKWVDYDVRWKATDENLSKTWKTNANGVKIKFGKDGDIKVKDKEGTTKYHADKNKVTTDSSHK